MTQKLVGIDPGEKESGIVLIRDMSIIEGKVLPNEFVWDKVMNYSDNGKITIVVEDIRPFSTKLTMQTIGTCKFIGELNYRAVMAPDAKLEYLTRFDVKDWVFRAFPEIAIPAIERKILTKHARLVAKGAKGLINKDGFMRKPSFVNVDDKIVRSAMAHFWKISDFGKGRRPKNGLMSHSWQALGVLSCYLAKQQAFLL